jgi:hypothetical protein
MGDLPRCNVLGPAGKSTGKNIRIRPDVDQECSPV